MTGLKEIYQDPTIIFEDDGSETVLGVIKQVLDPIIKGRTLLDEIHIDGLNASQIWPQAKMVLDSVTDELLFNKIPQLKHERDAQLYNGVEIESSEEPFNLEDFNDEHSNNEYSNNEFSNDEHSDDPDQQLEIPEHEHNTDESDNSENETVETRSKSPSSHVDGESEKLDDDFFSINDFNKMTLDMERTGGDAPENNDEYQEEDIDYFDDIPDSDSEDALYYNDFFSKPKKTRINNKKPEKEHANPTEFEEEDYDKGMESVMLDLFDKNAIEKDHSKDSEKKNLSSFEREQLKIQQEIEKLESDAITEKKWALKGESKAKDRPSDSLLEEDLEFERTAKPVPVITKEVTENLEDLIRRRIKEESFDDLPRRFMTDVPNFRSRKDFELSELKSSKSLAEIYEEEYKGDNTDAVSEALNTSHEEIKSLYQNLSFKLDALCSAHFIPKPAQKSIEIKSQAPAISMEDAQPLILSNADRLAPQEMFQASRSHKDSEITLKSGIVLSKDELSREDKQRLRRANKRKRSKELKSRDPSSHKKSKKQDVIDTLSKANNVTIINKKGEKRDVTGSLVKDSVRQGPTTLKL